MEILKNSCLTYGLSGKIGDLVFRQLNGKTVVSRAPRRRAFLSAAQQATVSTFKQAIIYAKEAVADTAIRLAYAAKARPGQTANNVAIADFFHQPVIGEIDINNSMDFCTIRVNATDDFKVVAVRIKIEDHNGLLVEEGEATPEADLIHWTYTTTPDAFAAGAIVTVTAIDLPGNATSKCENVEMWKYENEEAAAVCECGDIEMWKCENEEAVAECECGDMEIGKYENGMLYTSLIAGYYKESGNPEIWKYENVVADTTFVAECYNDTS